MTVLDDRVEVAQAFALEMTKPDFEAWLDEHPETQDADGEHVLMSFGARESVSAVIAATSGYDHSVMITTIFEGHIWSCIVGNMLPDGAPPPSGYDETVHADDTTTVADLLLEISTLPEGAKYVLEYARTRRPLLVMAGV